MFFVYRIKHHLRYKMEKELLLLVAMKYLLLMRTSDILRYLAIVKHYFTKYLGTKHYVWVSFPNNNKLFNLYTLDMCVAKNIGRKYKF